MAAHSRDIKGAFVTRRWFDNDASVEKRIEFIFQPKFQHNMYLLDGRCQVTNTNTWEHAVERGYLLLNRNGTVENGYGGTVTLTDMESGSTVNTWAANKLYKVVITGITTIQHRFVNTIGVRYNLTEPFRGSIHSVKITGLRCGYAGSDAINTGKTVDLCFQMNHVAGESSNFTNYIPSIDEMEEQPITGAIQQAGWSYSGNTWTQTGGTGWSKRLYLFKSANGSDGQKNYERLLKITFDAVIPAGRYINLYYNLPDGSHGVINCVNGRNEHVILIESASRDEDTERPKFDSDNAGGIQISNLKVVEAHGLLLQDYTWKEKSV